MDPKDLVLLGAIVEYANILKDAVPEYSIDEQTLRDKPELRGLAAFFVQQIGECSIKLSDGFKTAHPEIEWKEISGLRNRIAHAYGKIDVEILWDVVQNDAPTFSKFCSKQLKS